MLRAIRIITRAEMFSCLRKQAELKYGFASARFRSEWQIFLMIFICVNKRNWKHPGPVLNVGVHAAESLAAIGCETHLCVGAGEPEPKAVSANVTRSAIDTTIKPAIRRALRLAAARALDVRRACPAARGEGMAWTVTDVSESCRAAWLARVRSTASR